VVVAVVDVEALSLLTVLLRRLVDWEDAKREVVPDAGVCRRKATAAGTLGIADVLALASRDGAATKA
jgi:hypothetical protein